VQQKRFISQPPNPSPVVEGENLTLQWRYDLEETSVFLGRILNVTDGEVGAPSVVVKQQNGMATVQSGYENLYTAAMSDSEATLTILAVPRSYDGDKYKLTITTVDFASVPSDVLEINVLCKYKESWFKQLNSLSMKCFLCVLH